MMLAFWCVLGILAGAAVTAFIWSRAFGSRSASEEFIEDDYGDVPYDEDDGGSRLTF